jgi:hypothetical protein
MKSNKKPELCIPRISVEIKREFIFNTFCRLKIGYIERITEIPLKSNPMFKCVILRVKWNLSSEKAKYMFDRLSNKDPVYVVYDVLWYWKVVMNDMPTGIIAPPPYVPNIHCKNQVSESTIS